MIHVQFNAYLICVTHKYKQIKATLNFLEAHGWYSDSFLEVNAVNVGRAYWTSGTSKGCPNYINQCFSKNVIDYLPMKSDSGECIAYIGFKSIPHYNFPCNMKLHFACQITKSNAADVSYMILLYMFIFWFNYCFRLIYLQIKMTPV
jgi:hypothetical protein